jgi:hypothetical protein
LKKSSISLAAAPLFICCVVGIGQSALMSSGPLPSPQLNGVPSPCATLALALPAPLPQHSLYLEERTTRRTGACLRSPTGQHESGSTTRRLAQRTPAQTRLTAWAQAQRLAAGYSLILSPEHPGGSSLRGVSGLRTLGLRHHPPLAGTDHCPG